MVRTVKEIIEQTADIDIAVIVERLDDDYFKDTPLLWKLRRKISNLIRASPTYRRYGQSLFIVILEKLEF